MTKRTFSSVSFQWEASLVLDTRDMIMNVSAASGEAAAGHVFELCESDICSNDDARP